MKRILPLGLLLFALIISSCCTKKECVNAFDFNEISMRGFSSNDMDSIRVTAYEQGTNFATMIETGASTAYQVNDNGTDWRLVSSVDLIFDRNYRIEMLSSGLTYDITNILIQFKKCNSCFLKRDPLTSIEMVSFQVNGQLVEEAYFEIEK